MQAARAAGLQGGEVVRLDPAAPGRGRPGRRRGGRPWSRLPDGDSRRPGARRADGDCPAPGRSVRPARRRRRSSGQRRPESDAGRARRFGRLWGACGGRSRGRRPGRRPPLRDPGPPPAAAPGGPGRGLPDCSRPSSAAPNEAHSSSSRPESRDTRNLSVASPPVGPARGRAYGVSYRPLSPGRRRPAGSRRGGPWGRRWRLPGWPRRSGASFRTCRGRRGGPPRPPDPRRNS